MKRRVIYKCLFGSIAREIWGIVVPQCFVPQYFVQKGDIFVTWHETKLRVCGYYLCKMFTRTFTIIMRIIPKQYWFWSFKMLSMKIISTKDQPWKSVDFYVLIPWTGQYPLLVIDTYYSKFPKVETQNPINVSKEMYIYQIV